jgi:hypothetical protein
MSVSSKPVQEQLDASLVCQTASTAHNSKQGIYVTFKKTNELNESEKEQMRDLFIRVFNKTMAKSQFERKYYNTPKGYSYHGLMQQGGLIVGASSAVPGRYKFFEREFLFSLSVDTMIDHKYRGGGHLIKMINLVHQDLVKDGIPFIFGFPNEQYYYFQKRLLKYQDIGELDYYVLPFNIGSVSQKLKSLNILSRSFFLSAARLCRIPNNSETRHCIEKVADKNFEQHRYDTSYSRIRLDDATECIYKIYEESGGIRTLYIIDVIPLSCASLSRAVKQICRTAVKDVDILMYAGKLSMKPAGLLKAPDSKKPQRIRMTGKILIPDEIDESVFNIDNWRVNISDFDVR